MQREVERGSIWRKRKRGQHERGQMERERDRDREGERLHMERDVLLKRENQSIKIVKIS